VKQFIAFLFSWGRGQQYSQFCPKFRRHGNGSRWAKIRLAAFNGSSPKPLSIGAKISQKSLTQTKL